MPGSIVKVPRPLYSPEADPGFLVYDQHRTRIVQQSIPDAVDDALGSDLKGYFQATWGGSERRWRIGKRVDDQPW